MSSDCSVQTWQRLGDRQRLGNMVKRDYGLVNKPSSMLPTMLESISEVRIKPNPDYTLNQHLMIAFVGQDSIYVWKLRKIGPNPTCSRLLFIFFYFFAKWVPFCLDSIMFLWLSHNLYSYSKSSSSKIVFYLLILYISVLYCNLF